MSGDKYNITDQNALYFLTFTIIDWVDVLTRKEYKLIITDSMNYCVKNKGLVVYAWVIMSNHIHVIWRAQENYQISAIIRDFKKFTAKKILSEIESGGESRKEWMLNKFEFAGKRLNRIKKYKFWKDGNHAIFLDPFQPYLIDQKIDYIHNNPVENLLVENPEYYIFSSANDYYGNKGLVTIEILD
jgi:REP-associated tyrosine transposase